MISVDCIGSIHLKEKKETMNLRESKGAKYMGLVGGRKRGWEDDINIF